MSKKRLKCYYLEWHDAHGQCEWMNKDDIDKYKIDRTIIAEVGWKIHEDSDVVVITSQLTNDGGIGNTTRIPKGMIKVKKCLNPYAKKARKCTPGSKKK